MIQKEKPRTAYTQTVNKAILILNNVDHFLNSRLKTEKYICYWMLRFRTAYCLCLLDFFAFITFAIILRHLLVKPNSQSSFSQTAPMPADIDSTCSTVQNPPQWGLVPTFLNIPQNTRLINALWWPDVGRQLSVSGPVFSWPDWIVENMNKLIIKKNQYKARKLKKNYNIWLFHRFLNICVLRE